MKQIKKKNNLKLLVTLLIISVAGLVLLTAVKKTQDNRSSAAGITYCYLYNNRDAKKLVGSYKVGSLLTAYQEPNEEWVSFDAFQKAFFNGQSISNLKCFSDGWRSANYVQSNQDTLCRNKGGTCTANTTGACKTPQGLNGTVESKLCGGSYVNKYCCIPNPTCASKNGICVQSYSGMKSGLSCSTGGKTKGLTNMGFSCPTAGKVCCVK